MVKFDTPILFLVFNRPKETKQVFNTIRKVQPKKLFIAADGPRNKVEDKEKCKEVRAIVSNVDWDCEVKTLFRDDNLGCGRAVSGAIDWFFENVEQGIILEDDIIPDSSFFKFCQIMLKSYKNHPRVWHINGFSPFSNLLKKEKAEYFLSKYPMIWGWATWGEKWAKYNFKLDSLNTSFNKKMKATFRSRQERIVHINSFYDSLEIDTWDAQWKYAIFQNEGLCISPYQNLIKNIGFDENATHTKNNDHRFSKINSNSIALDNIEYQENIKPSSSNDSIIGKNLYEQRYNWKEQVKYIKNRINEYIKSV